MRREATVLVVACSLLASTGCGTPQEDAVEDALQDLSQAIEDKDATAFCAGVVVEQPPRACVAQARRGFEDLRASRIERVEDVEVKGSSATARITMIANGRRRAMRARLRQVDGGWRVVLGGR